MTKRKTMVIAGWSIATVISGGALTAAALPAMAETISSTASAATAAADPGEGGHEANGISEEQLTGEVAAQVEAAVLAEYPDVTIQRLETDAEGTYEAHVTQADGTRATVKLDDTFAITATETGRHGGGHRGNSTEEELTGDVAAQVEAAVLAEYPDATIERLETDAEGTYEAHITQADGTRATVKLDDTFAITATKTGRDGGGHHGDSAQEELTGDVADQVQAAVLAEYPDATIERLETDAEDTYEAHITQADGTRATVKLDDTFAITATETGRHGGGHHGDSTEDDSTDTDDSTTSGT